jgi:benzylsuccinate CoA-transferase BbsF subunit
MKHPLEGVRVIECGVAIAGPAATRCLAHLGADVIKIGSSETGAGAAPGWAKSLGPGAADLAAGGPNIGKRHAALNLKDAASRPALRSLVANADVFLTNLSMPAIESLALRFEDVVAWNPSIIYLSMPGFGESGPYKHYRSYGPNLSALSGLDHLTGDSDRLPVITPNPYPDYLAGYQAAVAVVSALLRRPAVKEAQHIRMSQLEALVGILGPQILDAQLSGNVPIRDGNRDPSVVPRDVFPCRGADRWISIEVRTDREWRALCSVEGMPPELRAMSQLSKAERGACIGQLEGLISRWTRMHTNRNAASILQAAGVAACPVQEPWDHLSDPHLESRSFWRLVSHSRLGADVVAALPLRFSGTSIDVSTGNPSFGEHTEEALRDVAGLSDATIEHLFASGVAAGPADIEALPGDGLGRPSRPWAWPLLRLLDGTPEQAVALSAAGPSGTQATEAIRVLDLSGELSVYGTHLLAHLGADIIRVETPSDSSVRAREPLSDGRSLFQAVMDAGKRSVTLDSSVSEDRDRLNRLIAGADVIYWEKPIDDSNQLAISWEQISASNPTAVFVSVSPFGESGPYSQWVAGELGTWAMGGDFSLCGYPDRRPVMMPAIGRSLIGSMAALGALAALCVRARTGQSQHVEISAHDVIAYTNSVLLAQIDDLAERTRQGTRALGSAPYGYFQCSDRLVCLLAMTVRQWDALAEWISEETDSTSVLDERYRGTPYSRFAYAEEIAGFVNSLAARHNADSFCVEAQRRGIPATPVNSVADVLRDEQLKTANFWELREFDKTEVLFPGPPFRFPGGKRLTSAPEHRAEGYAVFWNEATGQS